MDIFNIALLIGFLSAWLYCLDRPQLAVVFLTISAFLLRLNAAMQCPMPFFWDEQFHALVAKNMLQNPFKPMLYTDPVLPYDYRDWSSNNIWLHKQPLFLWQIALSIKLLGANYLSVRIPSIIMMSLLTPVIYRMGKLLTIPMCGFIAAILYALSSFQLQFATFAIHTDHNDVAFMFYVTLSLWAWIEFTNKPGYKWVLAIGLFAGCAVLVKWLTGLLVFSGWGLSIILISQKRKDIEQYKYFMLALVMAILVFLPWQIYCYRAFHAEYLSEMQYNMNHLFESVEGHAGNKWFHIDMLQKLYFDWPIIGIILVGSITVFVMKSRDLAYKIAIPLYIIIPYLIFTFAVTKMDAYTMFIAPLVFIMFTPIFQVLYEWLKITIGSSMLISAFVLLTFVLSASYAKMPSNLEGSFNIQAIKNKAFTDRIRKEDFFTNKKAVIINAWELGNLRSMFYTGIPTYDHIPDSATIKQIKDKGYRIVVFDYDILPSYLSNDSSVIKINYWDIKGLGGTNYYTDFETSKENWETARIFSNNAAYSGTRLTYTGPDIEFGSGINIKANKILLDKRLILNAKVYVKTSNIKTPTHLAISIEDSTGKCIFWTTKGIVQMPYVMPNKWFALTAEGESRPIQKGETIKMFVWNTERKDTVWIDDSYLQVIPVNDKK